jgi:hypothetical protein
MTRLWVGIACLMTLAANGDARSEGAATGDVATRKFAFDSLRRSIIHGLSVPVDARGIDLPADPAGLILLLGEMDSPDARRLLVGLIELRMAEADAEALFSAITYQGKEIEPALRGILGQPVRCRILDGTQETQRTPLSCVSPDRRDAKATRMIDLIEKGERIEYVP